MLGKSLKSYTFYLHQTKPIRGFSQKYLLLDLKTPRVLGSLSKSCFTSIGQKRADLTHVRKQIVHVKYATQLKTLQNLKTQGHKKLLTFLKALWVVIRTMWYLFECKNGQFKFPCAGSTVTKFWFRFKNYKRTHRKFRKKLKKGIIQEIKKSEL